MTVFPMAVLWCSAVTPSGALQSASKRKRERGREGESKNERVGCEARSAMATVLVEKAPRSVSCRRTPGCGRGAKSLPWRKDMTSNAGAERRRQGCDVSSGQPAKEIDEPDTSQPTAECMLMVCPSRRRLVSSRGELLPAQGGACLGVAHDVSLTAW